MNDFDIDQNIGSDLNSDFDNSPKTNFMQQIKPYIGPAFKVLILLLILFAAYYFFFMRYVNVSFEVINHDKGETYTEMTTTITLESNGESKDYDIDSPIKLLPGEYNLSINDPNLNNLFLREVDSYLTITKEDNDNIITINLYPEWAKNLSDFKLVKKIDTVYVNQLINFKATINNSGKQQKVTFTGKGDLEGLLISEELKTGENTIDFQFKNPKKNKESVSGYIEIDKANFLSLKFNSTTKTSPIITIKGNSNYTAPAGEDYTIILELDNTKNSNVIEDLNIKIDNSTPESDIITSWIKDIPSNIRIGEKSKTSVNLIFALPLKKENVSFDIYFINDYISVKKTITLTITDPEIILPKEIEFGLNTSGSVINKVITIENNTNYPIALEDITIDLSELSNNNTREQVESIIDIALPEKLEVGKTDIPFSIMIPSTFASDKIKGTIKIKSEISESTFDIPFSITIQGININFDISNLLPKYTFEYDPVSNYSEESQESIIIKNTGNIDINLISLNISGDTECKNNYFEITKQVPFGYTLKINEPFNTIFKLKKVLKPANSFDKVCSFDITYLDPRINNSQVIKGFPFNSAG